MGHIGNPFIRRQGDASWFILHRNDIDRAHAQVDDRHGLAILPFGRHVDEGPVIRQGQGVGFIAHIQTHDAPGILRHPRPRQALREHLDRVVVAAMIGPH